MFFWWRPVTAVDFHFCKLLAKMAVKTTTLQELEGALIAQDAMFLPPVQKHHVKESSYSFHVYLVLWGIHRTLRLPRLLYVMCKKALCQSIDIHSRNTNRLLDIEGQSERFPDHYGTIESSSGRKSKRRSEFPASMSAGLIARTRFSPAPVMRIFSMVLFP